MIPQCIVIQSLLSAPDRLAGVTACSIHPPGPVHNRKQQTGPRPTTKNVTLQPHSALSHQSASAETTPDAQGFSPPLPQQVELGNVKRLNLGGRRGERGRLGEDRTGNHNRRRPPRHFLLATSSIHASVSSCVASTQLSEKATHVLLPSAIQLLQLVIKHASFLERVVCLYNFSAERASSIESSGCSLRGRTGTGNGARDSGGGDVGSSGRLYRSLGRAGRKCLSYGRMNFGCHRQARN